MDCTVDFEGYGGYLSEEFEENIIKRGKCVYTFKITEGEDGYLINDIEIDWENKGL